jgi:hypothetical protein
MPDHIIVGESLPALADLGSVAKGGRVEIREDAEGDFGRSDGQEVDSEQRLEVIGEEGELGHTTLGQEAAEDELTMACWRRAEEGPDVGDNLLILVRQAFDVLIIDMRGKGCFGRRCESFKHMYGNVYKETKK